MNNIVHIRKTVEKLPGRFSQSSSHIVNKEHLSKAEGSCRIMTDTLTQFIHSLVNKVTILDSVN